MIRLAIGGYRGRMGQRVLVLAEQDDRFEITAKYDLADDPSNQPFDMLIDFSIPEGTMRLLSLCQQENAGLIVGATGHSDEQLKRIEDAATHIPILKAANFSIGINLLLKIVPQVARKLADIFDIEIIETHHIKKVDAPSGTALAFLESILSATGSSRKNLVTFGRHGPVGAKPSGQIGVHAVRSGDVIGRHEIVFGGLGESITFRHEAHSRDTFANGALEAAAWLYGKPPRLYTMKDVLTDRR